MTCKDCRELMLEADLSELRSEGSGELAAHLRTCDNCRQAAEIVVRSSLGLQHAIASLIPMSDVATITRRAAVERIVPLTSHRRRWSVVGVGIAAGLALAFVSNRFNPSRLPSAAIDSASIAPNAPPQGDPTLSVTVPAGQNAVVMQTSDPKISVVWIY